LEEALRKYPLATLVFVGSLTALPLGAAKPGDATNRWDAVMQLSSGQELRVVLEDVKSFQGRLQGVSENTVVLRLDTGEQTFERQKVLRVSTRSTSHRGRNVLIGLAVGLGAGIIVGVASPELGQGKCAQGSCVNAASVGVPGALGGAVGAGIGAAIPTGGWHDVYRAR
jgi:hypothetical protein